MGNNISDILFAANMQNLNNIASNFNSAQARNSESFKDALNSSASRIADVANSKANNSQSYQAKTVVENKSSSQIKDSSVNATSNSESTAKANTKTDASSNTGSNSDTTGLTGSKKTEAAADVIESANDIATAIKEKFSLTDEELKNAMEVLGLTMVDLFNQTDLQAVIMNATGISDSVELLTNVELYDGMKDMMGLAEGFASIIKEDFNLSDENFKNFINNDKIFEDYFNNEETNNDGFMSFVPENEIPLDENGNPEKIYYATEVGKGALEAEKINTETKETEIKAEESNVTTLPVNSEMVAADKNNQSEVKVEVTIENDATVNNSNASVNSSQNSNFSENGNQSKEKNSKNEANPFELNSLNQANSTNTANTVADIIETVESYSSVADAKEIMQQITDYIKVNIRANETSMEMQLHPASLGTVNMQVVSNNGQVTAHFTVQNEAVKAVLETQLINLQETLNEAGTKVNAIEVTVANYNLDKGADNQANEGNSNGSNKGSRRRGINLQGIDSLDDLDALGLDEAEMVEAKVMEMNGNTVNFKA